MNKIAIICAMQVELDAVNKMLTSVTEVNVGPRKFYCGVYKNKEIITTKCGIGKVNAAITSALLIKEFSPSVVINCGVAGGYS